jgi:hypothetical protein
MFQALCNRRNVRIKYERFANAQTAAAVYNVNRVKADDPIISAMDFVRDEESSRKKERLDAAKRHCKKVLSNVPAATPLEKIMEIRSKAIKDLETSGYENADDIFNQCWPSLAKKG